MLLKSTTLGRARHGSRAPQSQIIPHVHTDANEDTETSITTSGLAGDEPLMWCSALIAKSTGGCLLPRRAPVIKIILCLLHNVSCVQLFVPKARRLTKPARTISSLSLSTVATPVQALIRHKDRATLHALRVPPVPIVAARHVVALGVDEYARPVVAHGVDEYVAKQVPSYVAQCAIPLKERFVEAPVRLHNRRRVLATTSGYVVRKSLGDLRT